MIISAQEATINAALIAAFVSLVSLWVSLRSLDRKDRSILLWEREILRLVELEEKVASIKHLACGTTTKWDMEHGAKSFDAMLSEFEDQQLSYGLTVGRYARYPDLIVAANRVVNYCAALMDKRKQGVSKNNSEKVEILFQKFLEELDSITDRSKLLPHLVRRAI